MIFQLIKKGTHTQKKKKTATCFPDFIPLLLKIA